MKSIIQLPSISDSIVHAYEEKTVVGGGEIPHLLHCIRIEKLFIALPIYQLSNTVRTT